MTQWPNVARRCRDLRERLRQNLLLPLAWRRFGRLAVGEDLTDCRRILLVRVDGMGDVVMTLPAVRVLRQCFPRAQIDVVVRPWSAPLFFEPGLVDNVWLFETARAPRRTRAETQSPWGLIRRLRMQRYDVAIDIAGRENARRLAFHSGARRCIGPVLSRYDTSEPPIRNYAFLLSNPVNLSDGGDRASQEHPVDSFLRVLPALGVSVPTPVPYDFSLPEECLRATRCVLQQCGINRPFGVVHPFASEAQRNWPIERFAAIADHLIQAHDLDVVVTGSKRDADGIAELRRRVRFPNQVVEAAGSFSLPVLAAVYRQSEVMVTVDTGPMHVADMAGAPLAALFLPWFAQNRPYRQPDAVLLPPGMAPDCGFNAHPPDAATTHYLAGISIDQVRERVDAKLKTRKIPSTGCAARGAFLEDL